MPKISICLPFHQTPETAELLSRALDSISKQTYTNYEIILTSEGAFARNHNAAIMKATGDIVQMMGMDDYFADEGALQRIVDGFKPFHYMGRTKNPEWLISASLHNHEDSIGWPHVPEWTDDIYTGNNRLGSVSTLSFRRGNQLLFEEPLTWVVDVDLYYRFYLKYGEPKILMTPNVVIGTRTTRLSSTLSDQVKMDEINYLIKKYA